MRAAHLMVLACLAALPAARAQQPQSLPERDAAFVALTRAFAFYSDSATNAHDFLLWNARAAQPVEPRPDCVAALPGEQRTAFERAREYYERTFTDASGERLRLALRWRLAGFAAVQLVDEATLAQPLAELRGAAAAYERCWWAEHDLRNRRWIAAVAPLLVANEDALRARLERLYGQPLPRPLPVDVVGYVGFSGADSVTDPDHLLVSSANRANAGLAALEIVFHEASHTVFGPRVGGPLWDAFEQAAAARGTALPPDLWHAVLFFTTGKAVAAQLAGQGAAEYEPYVYAEGLFERAWPRFREPLEREWQPYLDGRASPADAAKRVLDALAAD